VATANKGGVLARLGALCAAVFLTSCAEREVIRIPEVTGTAKPFANRINDYADAAKTIAYFMLQELKLPAIETEMIVYPSLVQFEAGLVTELGLTPGAAAAQADALALANCKHRKVVANGYNLSRVPWMSRFKTLAHEMTHIVQFHLGDWTCSSPHRWIVEGMADWVAFKVVDALKLATFAKQKEHSGEQVARFQYGRKLPTLSQISTSGEWEQWMRTLGHEATYGQAFLAVDLLIERKGLDDVIEYFKRFSRSNNRQSHFSGAFGDDLPAFEREFGAQLKKLL